MDSPDFSDVPPVVARRLTGVWAIYGRMIYDQMGYLNNISQKRAWISIACAYVAFVLGYVVIIYYNFRTITLPGHGAEIYSTWPLWVLGCVLFARTSWLISGAHFYPAAMRATSMLFELARQPLARPVFVAIRDNDPRNAYSFVAYRTLHETEQPAR